MLEIIASIVVIVGALLILLAAVGLWRMPDFYARLHCTTKPGLLGAGMILFGLILHSGDPAVVTRALVLIVFLLVTGPIAGHIIAYAGWLSKVPSNSRRVTLSSAVPDQSNGDSSEIKQ